MHFCRFVSPSDQLAADKQAQLRSPCTPPTPHPPTGARLPDSISAVEENSGDKAELTLPQTVMFLSDWIIAMTSLRFLLV